MPASRIDFSIRAWVRNEAISGSAQDRASQDDLTANQCLAAYGT